MNNPMSFCSFEEHSVLFWRKSRVNETEFPVAPFLRMAAFSRAKNIPAASCFAVRNTLGGEVEESKVAIKKYPYFDVVEEFHM